MIKVNVISKVEIPDISEATITELIKQEILKSNPDIVINEVTFERKLSPNRIIAKVDAQVGNSSVPVIQAVTVKETVESPSEPVTTESVEEPDDQPLVKTDSTAPVITVSDLFDDED